MQPSKKKILIILNLLLSLIFLEGLSALLLATVIQDKVMPGMPESRLVSQFPAQLRMSAEEIRKEFPPELPLMRIGNFISMQYDPAMGFRKDGHLQWFGGDIKEADKKFLIVTFGGSTTVGDNWPKYLRQFAEQEKVQQDLLILNAGLWGYMSFIEKIYFSSWILPMLDQAGVKPKLVLSLDGANDVWTRILSYYLSKNQNMPWLDQYHGYHQQLAHEIQHIGNTSTVLTQLLSNAVRGFYSFSVNHLSIAIPYTMKLMLAATRKMLQREKPMSEVVQAAQNSVRQLEPDTENRIIAAMENNLRDFYGMAQARDIPFVGYLQPVLLPQYHPYPTPKTFLFPNFNFEAINLHQENRLFSVLTGNFVVETDHLYMAIETMYSRMNHNYPGSFKSLASIFSNSPQTEQLYAKDAVHYEQQGKETIAHAIVKDLLEKGILTRTP
ncbi:MAG: hypothetical protein HQL93_08895 [Magnetococcales bacterium]|nr:hypothetical protein [Magnetococcales bacterium]